tara:strand:+ start:864 stop:1172 length:309 start_codon:yes stop_codon:yes gene_type:complete
MNSSKAYELEHGTDIRPGHEGKSMKEILQEAYTEKFERTKYIFVLDFNEGKVYKYNIRALCNEKNEWNPDHESCEAFLLGAGHKLGDCEWMVTNNEDIEYGN